MCILKKIVLLVIPLFLPLWGGQVGFMRAGEKRSADSVYNSTQIKLDIASPVVTSAIYQWKMQHYEIAANVQLAKRFFPTLELGYAGGRANRGDSIAYNGHGGFFRVGCDINPLKKHKDSPHALLVGIRIGTAVQGMEQTALKQTLTNKGVRADCWGEIVLGCQVEIAKLNHQSPGTSSRQTKGATSAGKGQSPMAFYMGWMGRLKCLFTRQNEYTPAADQYAIYIPGFGNRDNIGWGLNYYLGWRF